MGSEARKPGPFQPPPGPSQGSEVLVEPLAHLEWGSSFFPSLSKESFLGPLSKGVRGTPLTKRNSLSKQPAWGSEVPNPSFSPKLQSPVPWLGSGTWRPLGDALLHSATWPMGPPQCQPSHQEPAVPAAVTCSVSITDQDHRSDASLLKTQWCGLEGGEQ